MIWIKDKPQQETGVIKKKKTLFLVHVKTMLTVWVFTFPQLNFIIQFIIIQAKTIKKTAAEKVTPAIYTEMTSALVIQEVCGDLYVRVETGTRLTKPHSIIEPNK